MIGSAGDDKAELPNRSRQESLPHKSERLRDFSEISCGKPDTRDNPIPWRGRRSRVLRGSRHFRAENSQALGPAE